jgi:hypothetical protein
VLPQDPIAAAKGLLPRQALIAASAGDAGVDHDSIPWPNPGHFGPDLFHGAGTVGPHDVGEVVSGLREAPEDEEVDPVEGCSVHPDQDLVWPDNGRPGHVDQFEPVGAPEAGHG